MQVLWLGFLLALTAVDLLVFEVRLTTVALLYVVLRVQADTAAKRYLLERERQPEEELPNLRAKAQETPKREASRPAPPKPAPRPAMPAPLPAQPEIRYPNFHGRPHEVLGIAENAATKLIVKAFRKWIQKFHPDHTPGDSGKEHATLHARQLSAAKEALLERRKREKRAA